METNRRIPEDSELAHKARALFQAARDYWEAFQCDHGPSAVVWVENDNGHFVLFTRGEYKESIMGQAYRDTRGAEAMFEPFTDKSL